MRYVILCDSRNVEVFEEPRQLAVVNGERLIDRTIRLLKNNNVNDIWITSHDNRFDDLGAVRYEPKYNDYDPIKGTGFWLNAFPVELMDRPITFLLGDVYYSENAIHTIVTESTSSTLFFCSHKNADSRYIKQHDEPFAYKVVNTELFKAKIDEVKQLHRDGHTCRHPIVWELYRHINGIWINNHIIGDNCVIINDETCDIDRPIDIDELNNVIG